MIKYLVTMSMQLQREFEVEAEDERAAEEKAFELGDKLSVDEWYLNHKPYYEIIDCEEVGE